MTERELSLVLIGAFFGALVMFAVSSAAEWLSDRKVRRGRWFR